MEYNGGVKFYQRSALPMNILRLTHSSLPLPAAHLGESYSGSTKLSIKRASAGGTFDCAQLALAWRLCVIRQKPSHNTA